jgi:hypothetical protein
VQCLTILLISGELSICPFLYASAAERLTLKAQRFSPELRLRPCPAGLHHVPKAAASLAWKDRVAGLYVTSENARKTKIAQTYLQKKQEVTQNMHASKIICRLSGIRGCYTLCDKFHFIIIHFIECYSCCQ